MAAKVGILPIFHNFFPIAVSYKNQQSEPEFVGKKRYDVISWQTEHRCRTERRCDCATVFPAAGFWFHRCPNEQAPG
jgi:hypothetical protein